MWAFVGSGPSIDAGYPGWGELVGGVVRRIEKERRARVIADQRYVKAARSENWPNALSRIEKLTEDREWL